MQDGLMYLKSVRMSRTGVVRMITKAGTPGYGNLKLWKTMEDRGDRKLKNIMKEMELALIRFNDYFNWGLMIKVEMVDELVDEYLAEFGFNLWGDTKEEALAQIRWTNKQALELLEEAMYEEGSDDEEDVGVDEEDDADKENEFH